jgi:beta-lactamase superfamily II metal-dependent hydrolase
MKSAIIIILLTLLTSCANIPTIDELFDRESSQAIDRSGNIMKIVVIDVGQGDSTLIISPEGEAMLIDTGNYIAGKHAILPLLEHEGIDELKYIVITHYHEDHVGGLAAIKMGHDEFDQTDDMQPTGGIYDRGAPTPTSIILDPSYALYALANAGYRESTRVGEQLDLGSVTLEIVASSGLLADGTKVEGVDPEDENASSIALIIEYSGFRMFVGGDITGGGGSPPYQTPDVESELAPLVGDIDVLKVSHHGSKTSTNQRFLDVTTPEFAIISVGENDHGHPHASVIERLLDSGIEIYQTEAGALASDDPIVADGNIVIEVNDDGEYTVNY